MALSEIRARWNELKDDYRDHPLSEVVEALLDLTENHAYREQKIGARLDHLTDLMLARNSIPDTLPREWTEPT